MDREKLKVGFIGCGNMAGAMIEGMIRAKVKEPSLIYASNRSGKKLVEIKERLGINVNQDNRYIAQNADILFISVKPHIYPAVLEEIRDLIDEKKIVISIAPGLSLKYFKEVLGEKTKTVRTVPNTPALVGAGITAVCPGENITEEDLETVMLLLKSFGEAELVEERLFDAVTAVSGSSPAYVFMFMEAMADAAVSLGMPRDQAYRFSENTVKGSACLALETGRHPGELKDMVCSPGGTTIEAVRELELRGMRSAVIEAMKKCAEKSNSMKK